MSTVTVNINECCTASHIGFQLLELLWRNTEAEHCDRHLSYKSYELRIEEWGYILVKQAFLVRFILGFE